MYKTKHYPDFGLTIIKNKDWHITYRHPTFNKKQPTGHFHQDALSITISYKGMPILVDPGSYVYTSNKKWRNLMRSYESHNNFFITNNTLENQDTFLLNKVEQTDSAQIKSDNKTISIKNHAVHLNAIAHRKLVFINNNNNNNKITSTDCLTVTDCLIVTDWWEERSNSTSYWNFIFHPNIKLIKINYNLKKTFNVFEIFYNSKKIFYLKSNLDLKLKSGHYSPQYNTVTRCQKLTARSSIINLKKIHTILYPAKT